MPYELLTVDHDEHIAVVTLNRPKKLNAINRELRLEMMEACRELRDDDLVRVAIFTGAGRGFCSGADLTSDRSNGANPSRAERLDEYNWVGRQAMMVYKGLDKPTIAAVNGVAAGAGMGLALACDMRVGCENSRFKTVFIERSLSPDSGLSYFLPRIVGSSRAFDLVFTSRTVDADEAWRLGLLDRMAPAENLLDEAKALARQIASWPPVAMQMSKRALQRSLDTDLADQLEYETHSIVFPAAPPTTWPKPPHPSANAAHPSSPANSAPIPLSLMRQGQSLPRLAPPTVAILSLRAQHGNLAPSPLMGEGRGEGENPHQPPSPRCERAELRGEPLMRTQCVIARIYRIGLAPTQIGPQSS